MQIIKLSKERYKDWDAFVKAHPQSRIYHTTPWKAVFEESFGRETHYLMAVEGNNIQAVLPLVKFHSPIAGKMHISLPYVNYGGILSHSQDSTDALLESLRKLRQQEGSEVAELRTASSAGYGDLPCKTSKVTFLLELADDEDTMMQSFKAKLRSQIRRPQKENMYGRVGGLDLLEDYYYVFTRNMRDLGTPVYHRSFFESILHKMPENAKIVVVYTEDHLPVAAAFIIGYKQVMEIPWASSLREYNRYSPNMLLYWEVICEAIRGGYKIFDFGRGTKDGGTHRFKKQWGGSEETLYWYYDLASGQDLPEVNKENPKYALAIKIWQKLPLALTNRLGPSIVKHLP